MSLLSLEKFDCNGESTSVGVRWERWKRALFIYLEASNIDKDVKKKASLLHFGGLDLQEVFYNIPGANIEPSEGVDVFEVAISKLDSYFAPKQSRVYERHTFRLLKQEPEEKFEKFLVRLRKQADKYRVITEANTLELVNKQLEEFKDLAKSNGNEEVNKVNSRFKRNFDKPRNVQHGCGRCGNPRHVATDTKCPARDKECLKCGLKGHFRQYCRTRQAFKRKIEKEYSHDQKKGRIEREKNEVNQLRDSSNEMAQRGRNREECSPFEKIQGEWSVFQDQNKITNGVERVPRSK
ncbi:hypothetical protein EVAR_65418_1 [Eumeta japonica]|uniref:CCHC-type domain-containing protein n=1 Tax=Eumeta variegata TaxID=151549 RepID=A0A4C1YHZ3_EUMVA|nr:hypothetical protein EVAR_65418_1 [Eumeta japonica]